MIFMTGSFGRVGTGFFRPIDLRLSAEICGSPYRQSSCRKTDLALSHIGGNAPIHRRNAGREILKALRENEAVGILFDQNTTRREGVFADFFGIPAATTPAIAMFALRTGAAVVPGFLIWDADLENIVFVWIRRSN